MLVYRCRGGDATTFALLSSSGFFLRSGKTTTIVSLSFTAAAAYLSLENAAYVARVPVSYLISTFLMALLEVSRLILSRAIMFASSHDLIANSNSRAALLR